MYSRAAVRIERLKNLRRRFLRRRSSFLFLRFPMNTCGECFFARHHSDPKMIECGGVPPTPIFFGMQPVKVPQFNPNAGVFIREEPQPIMRCVSPPLPKTYPACALFRDKGLNVCSCGARRFCTPKDCENVAHTLHLD